MQNPNFGFRVCIFVCCLFSVFCCLPSNADISDLAMKRGIGARAAGMGGAATAIVNDASALFYNPAGLAQNGIGISSGNYDTTAKLMNNYYTGIKLGYLGYLNAGFKDVSNNNEVHYTSYGLANRSAWLNYGLTYKEVNSNINGIANNGWSSDLGVLARITPSFNLGFTVQDAVAYKSALVPATARLGIGLKNKEESIVLAGDLEYAQNSVLFGHLGAELCLARGFAVRGGIDRGMPTAGVGMDMGILTFDYAVEKDPQKGYVQRVEAGLKFMPRNERPFSIVKPKEFALIDVAGALKGGRSEYSIFGGYQLGIDSMQETIRRAAKDPFIDGIMLKISGFNSGLTGMAMVQELRNELERFKKTGKKVVAYVDGSAVGEEYYLASVADRIIAPPGASIGGFGKSVAIYRTSGLFEKLGIEYKVFTKGKYKDAFDPNNVDMSNDQRDMIASLISDLYRQMLGDISKDRHIKLEKIRKLDTGIILTAKEAKQKGLIDEIGYYNTAMASASKLCGGKDEPAQLIAPEQVDAEEYFFNQVFGIAVIEIDGELITGAGGENMIFGGRYVGSQTVAQYIKQASDDGFVKAIILRVNSPGGDAIAAGEIYQAMKYAKEKQKKIIASMGNIAASGGYYIACAADKIIADPSSITGSIGVIGTFPIHKKLMKKFNLKADVIKEGKYADMFSGLRDMTTEEVKIIDKLQTQAYDEFLSAVVEGRKLATKEVERLAQGRIYTGNQALDHKLIDKLGSFGDAIDLAKKEADIPGEPRLIFYHQPSMFFNFGDGIAGAKLFSGMLPWIKQDKLSLPDTPYSN